MERFLKQKRIAIFLGIGALVLGGVFFSVLPKLFAFNDTVKTWTFNTANTGNYVKTDTTIDDTGAHPTGGQTGANEFSNPDFFANTDGWNVAAAPPAGWVEVPGNNATYGTQNFLVMKYEAKCALTSSPTTGLATNSTGYDTYSDNTAGQACTSANGKQVVSVASGYPIANISQTDAITRCQNVSINGIATHLITNDEWMTITRNAEAQPGNWTNGSVGSGYLFAGHNDNAPAKARVASTTDTGNNACAYTDTNGTTEAPSPCPSNTANGQSGSAGNQKRVLTLGNGSPIWDIAGNVWEWTNDTILGKNEPTGSSPGFSWREFTALTTYGTLSYEKIRPANASYSSAYGVGQIYSDGTASNSSTYGFVRGGRWNNGAYAGAFSVALNNGVGYQDNSVGFRCASDPVALSQSFSSSGGRAATGSNFFTTSSLTDAKITQSLNVGDTATYDFSVYAHNDTPGSVGGTVNATVASLFANGSVVSTAYADMGNGWWKLSGTLTGANASREYGVLLKAGKSVTLDDFTLVKQATYGVYTTSAYQNALAVTYDAFCEGVLSGSTCVSDVTQSGNSVVRYQLCDDNGATCESGNAWKYWNGSSWQTATNATTHTNTGAELTQSAMNAFPSGSKKIAVKAIFVQEGGIVPKLPHLSIGLTTDVAAPDINAQSITMFRHNGGATVLSGEWTNDLAPYFVWQSGSDVFGGSGLKGYCLYLGTDPSGNPATSKGAFLGTSPVSTAGTTCQFIVAASANPSLDFATLSYRANPWLASSTAPYYLNIKAIDNAGNVFTGDSASFAFRFDNTPPSPPAYISLPGDFVSSKTVSVVWPTGGTNRPQDADSAVAGLQYRIGSSGVWYGDAHTGTQDMTDLLVNDGEYTTIDPTDFDALAEGSNTIQFRAWDNAGNSSVLFASGEIKLNTVAPGTPRNLVAAPDNAETNEYVFSWSAPDTYAGQSGNITYCYTVNTTPSPVTCTYTNPGVTSVSKDAYATQPGDNVFYVVAKDEAGNINYDTRAQVTFTYSGTAPGIPTGIDIADVSVKATSSWKLAISWEKPENAGAGVETYKVYRSVDNVSFASVATATDISYVDTNLEQKTYFYKVKACDSANNCGAFSGIVSLYPDGKFTDSASLSSGPEVSNITTKRATIKWSTGRASDSRVQYGKKSKEYYEEEPSKSEQTMSHEINLTNLAAGTRYHFKARWMDEDGNVGMSEEKTFETDPAPEVIESRIRDIGIDHAVMEFKTKNANAVEVLYGESVSFGGKEDISTGTGETKHIVSLENLKDETKYFYRVNTFDAEEDEYEGDIDSFVTLPRPRIENVRIQQVRNSAQPAIFVTWDSNTEISSLVSFSPEDNSDLARNEINTELVRGEHAMVLRGLLPQKTYRIVVKGTDAFGNQAVSDTLSLTTATDTRPPQISDLSVQGNNNTVSGNVSESIKSQIVIAWNTDEPSTSQVEFGEGTGTGYSQKTQEDENLTTNHLVIISELTPSKVYHLRALGKDSAGNLSRSSDTVTITPKAVDSAFDLVVLNLKQIFGL